MRHDNQLFSALIFPCAPACVLGLVYVLGTGSSVAQVGASIEEGFTFKPWMTAAILLSLVAISLVLAGLTTLSRWFAAKPPWQNFGPVVAAISSVVP